MSGQSSQLAIPSAPAFNLLGVTPEYISKPSDVKQFKVDWRIKNYKIAPDLALEAQPLWWLYYQKRGLSHYQKSKKIGKILATTSLSLGTSKIDGINHLAYALKWNLYKNHNSSQVRQYLDSIATNLKPLYQQLSQSIDSLDTKMNASSDQEEKKKLARQIDDTKNQISAIQQSSLQQYHAFLRNPIYDPWNNDFIELAIGRVYTYDNAAIDSFNLKRAGWGAWLSAGKKMGQNCLISGLINLKRIGQNTNLTVGSSFRYGNDKFNFYSELIYVRRGNSIHNGAIEDNYFFSKYEEDIGTGWLEFASGAAYKEVILSYGGEFKLKRNILLNFALKTFLDNQLHFSKLIPVANLTCLML